MFDKVRTFSVAAAVIVSSWSYSGLRAQQPVFRSGAERVTVAVVVRDRDGRPIRNLSEADFEVTDDGERREILDFRNEVSPISVGFLLDSSGSMHIGPKLERAREVGHFLLSSMSEGSDEAALFVFDKMVRTAQPFTNNFDKIRSSFAAVRPWGSTSLYDAIAETSQQLSNRPGRRAIIVLTDGVDTSSQLTSREVSGIASAIDMPVYVIAMDTSVREGELTNLARWSGGTLYGVINRADGSVVARQIVSELRHQYLIAFEPRSSEGWHRIDVRSRRRATLQARSGYWVGRSTLDRSTSDDIETSGESQP
jgi:Ca-activated chloride channel family protein